MFHDNAFREIDETAGSASDDRFDAIVDRVKKSGASIVLDEETPLYVDVGSDEVEVGVKRVVEFNLNFVDYQIVRYVKNVRVVGEGHKKSFVDLDRPMVEIKLKSKPEISDNWVFVDIDDVF